jgi:hypothetical protein
VGSSVAESHCHPYRCLFDCSALESCRCAAHWKDKLMDRTNTSKDHPDFKAALILAVLTPICSGRWSGN